MKPKRIGTHKTDYNSQFNLRVEEHPVYEYRGYIIARDYSVANTPSKTYFAIYKKFEDGKPTGYDFYLNQEDGWARLKYVTEAIDSYLEGVGKDAADNTP